MSRENFFFRNRYKTDSESERTILIQERVSFKNRHKTEWMLKDVFDEMLETSMLKEKYLTYRIEHIWRKLIGPVIMSYTTKVSLKNKKMFVYVDSPVVRKELNMLRSELLYKMQEQIGEEYIKEIVIR